MAMPSMASPSAPTSFRRRRRRRRSEIPPFTCYPLAILAFIPFLGGRLVAPAPILAPDIRICNPPADLPKEEDSFNCCAPSWDRPPLDFRLSDVDISKPLRVRRPIHELSSEEIARLDWAYALMKALPDDDPRSFTQQANIHCAYCNTVYYQFNTTVPYQVHGSWLFFPYHRWYLYFHELILASLLDDDTFALPFWNYDHPKGSTMPQAYIDNYNLNDTLRDSAHQPPSIVMIDFVLENGTIRTAEEQLAANTNVMHIQVVSGAKSTRTFFGQAYRKGDVATISPGTVEFMAHNSVHGWVGDRTQIGWKDMGSLYAAARDPVFYTHHANLDRMWTIWQGIKGNEDIDDPDYLDSEFTFYNEKKELVKVRVQDSIFTKPLGYVYEGIENIWLNSSSTETLSSGPSKVSGSLCKAGEALLKPCSVVIARNKAMANFCKEEVVVVKGIQTLPNGGDNDGNLGLGFSRFESFVNFPSADENTKMTVVEYAGSYSPLPQMRMFISNSEGKKGSLGAILHLGVSSIIEKLGLFQEDTLVITLVPRTYPPYSPASFSNITIQYEGCSSTQLHPYS